jgi:outer membrane receptor protein involved in Fe transport
LRGPQGTLYGRSATGGVVAFRTNDPKLQTFGVDVSADYGTASRLNTEAAVNVPIGEKVALRAAARYFYQGEGYYNGEGGKNEIMEGRLKALFQPTEDLSFLLSLTSGETQSYSGGWSQSLTAPDEINYEASYIEPNKGVPTKRKMGSLNVNYDLEGSSLTYIGAMHSTDNRGQSGVGLNRSSYQYSVITGEPTETQTHEIRWTSDTEGGLTWLFGANYYKNTWDTIGQAWQASDLSSTDPASYNAFLFAQYNKGDTTDYGIFTEETFKLSDALRLTAGVRYDKMKINNYAGYDFNTNLAPGMVGLNPPDIVHYPEDSTYFLDEQTFDNVTYKLRFEYDLTPENMLYAMTATGFLPGNSELNVAMRFHPPPDMYLEGIDFVVLPFAQEKLTSYEVGSKNQFLDNTLQLNGSIFYYDYEGYQEAVNTNPPGSPPPPNFMVLRVPVEMYGLEIDATWLLTQYDKVTFSGGWLNAEVTSYPDIPGSEPPVSSKEYMYLKEVPGLPPVSFLLGYDHTFVFGNGSTLVPAAQLRYTGGYYLGQATTAEAASTDANGNSYLDYLYQDSVVLGDITASWTSASGKFSATGYVRNVTDERYKTSATLPTGSPMINVTVGDPRTYGLMLRAKF